MSDAAEREPWTEGPDEEAPPESWLVLDDDELLHRIETCEPGEDTDERLLEVVGSHRHFFIRQEAAKKVADRRRLFDFVLEEWPTFREVSLRFLGAPETVVPQMLVRITDPTYLETKKWACLCRVPEAAQDRNAAKALVGLGQHLSDPFAREVSTVLLKRFF